MDVLLHFAYPSLFPPSDKPFVEAIFWNVFHWKQAIRNAQGETTKSDTISNKTTDAIPKPRKDPRIMNTLLTATHKMMLPTNEWRTRNLRLPRATIHKTGSGLESFLPPELFNGPISSPMECRNMLAFSLRIASWQSQLVYHQL